jgi:hypothetical protein
LLTVREFSAADKSQSMICVKNAGAVGKNAFFGLLASFSGGLPWNLIQIRRRP